MFPDERKVRHVTRIGVTACGSQDKRRLFRDGKAWSRIYCRNIGVTAGWVGTAISAGCKVRGDFVVTAVMEPQGGIIRDIVRAAVTGIGHDRDAAAGFPGGSIVTSRATRGILSMVGSVLVSKFVRPKANGHRVAGRRK